jgi:high-affinity iron transporter
LAIVVGVAVLREGSEIVLFLLGIASAGGQSAWAMAGGAVVGVLCGAGLSALMYFGLIAIPVRRLFAVTTALITLLAAGMASQALAFLQQAGYFAGMSNPVWNTSWILAQDSIPGRLLHGLIGYSDSPSAAQLIAYFLTITIILGFMRIVELRRGLAESSLVKT